MNTRPLSTLAFGVLGAGMGIIPAGAIMIVHRQPQPSLTAPTPAATLTPDTTPAQILRVIDADGRDHFVLGSTIIRVERATFPDRSTWVTLAGSGWNPVLTVTGEPKDVAAAWAAAAGLKVAPVAVGVPPSAPVPTRAVNP